MGLLGAAPDKKTTLAASPLRTAQTPRTTHNTGTPHHTNTGASRAQSASASLLAASHLHQPGLPQGSGPDWLLSPPAHDKRASHRGLLWLLLWALSECVHNALCDELTLKNWLKKAPVDVDSFRTVSPYCLCATTGISTTIDELQ